MDRAAVLRFLDGTEAGTVACLDWLQEREASLADVLLLYAGTPPDWLAETHVEDEALRGLVAAWCRHTERRRLAEYPDFRWERVESLRGNYWGAVGRLDLARARRAQKRAVLALFPEVTREVQCEVTYEARRNVPAPAASLREWGFNPVASEVFCKDEPMRRCRVFSQTLAAPDWIPPEPAAVYDYTDLDAAADALSIRPPSRPLIFSASRTPAPCSAAPPDPRSPRPRPGG